MKTTFAILALAFLQEKGGMAPDFSGKNQAGKEIKFADLNGKKNVLVAFYPKDFTGG